MCIGSCTARVDQGARPNAMGVRSCIRSGQNLEMVARLSMIGGSPKVPNPLALYVHCVDAIASTACRNGSRALRLMPAPWLIGEAWIQDPGFTIKYLSGVRARKQRASNRVCDGCPKLRHADILDSFVPSLRRSRRQSGFDQQLYHQPCVVQWILRFVCIPALTYPLQFEAQVGKCRKKHGSQ